MNLLVQGYIFICNRQPNRFSIHIVGYEVDVRSIAVMCCFITSKIFIDMQDLINLLNLNEGEKVIQFLILI